MKYFAKQDAVESCEIVDETFLLHLQDSAYFSLNGTGTYLWNQLIDGSTIDELVASLIAEFEIDEVSARGDVETCLAELRSHGLVST